MVETNEQAAELLDKVASICTTTDLSEAARMGAAALRAERPIPVEEETPQTEEFVLAYVLEGRYKNVHFVKCWMRAEWDNHEKRWILADFPLAEGFTVTHWRPLPADPAGEEGNG